jgi:hypothetical protein
VWRFRTETFHRDQDVGAGPTVSPPGVNGFADGVVYVAGKSQIMYALNLRTGQKLWEFRVRDDSPNANGTTRSSAALVGRQLFFGYGSGVYALDAVTGAKLWKTEVDAPSEVVSSPAVTGPPNDRVLIVGDLSGKVTVLALKTGAKLYTYQTGGLIYGSAAVSTGRFFIASHDGYLYAFGIGGPNGGESPQTTITDPLEGSTAPNPSGALTVRGTASDDTAVTRVYTAVLDRNTSNWYDAATGTWSKVFTENLASLTHPGAAATEWSWQFPVSLEGGRFVLQAQAVDESGQRTLPIPQSRFDVASLGSPPTTAITNPVFRQVFQFPNGERAPFPITVEGTATDSGGGRPGVARVLVVVQNLEHTEYWCGRPCPGQTSEDAYWSPSFQQVEATLADPGGVSTDWSLPFWVYDHPHKYRITAWAIDQDGERDPHKATVQRICVRDPGDRACS